MKKQPREKRLTVLTVFTWFFASLFVLVTLAPVFAHVGWALLSRPIYFVSGFLCHQMYTRSIHFFDLQVAVCARDQFMYLAMGMAAYLTNKHGLEKTPVWLALLMILPAGLDGGTQYLSALGFIELQYQSTMLIRAVTGGLFGCGMGYFIFPMLREAEEQISKPDLV